MGFETNATNSSDVLREIQTFLHDEYGLYFTDDKLYSLRNKIHRRIRRLSDVESIVEYSQYLQQHDQEIHNFLDEVSTNKTHFFRESVHFDHMKKQFIPDRNETIRIWSSACSTGPEPYSASMILDDQTNQPYKILATDLSNDALMQAQQAIYPQREYQKVRSYQPDLTRYMEPEDDQDHQYQVVDSITAPICLRHFNLKNHPPPLENNLFDVIFCRNVMIYFDQSMIQQMVREFFRCLQPGGYLYIGRTESLSAINHSFVKEDPSVFRRPD